MTRTGALTSPMSSSALRSGTKIGVSLPLLMVSISKALTKLSRRLSTDPDEGRADTQVGGRAGLAEGQAVLEDQRSLRQGQ